MKTAVIIGNGKFPSMLLVQRYLSGADIIICADGGVNSLFERGLKPHIVIGDMDSIKTHIKNRLPSNSIIVDKDANKTDTVKAVEYALKKGYKQIILMGVVGKRTDQTLGNISIFKTHGNMGDIKIVTDHCEISLIHESIKFRGEIGQKISLIPLLTAEGVTTEGLEYPLKNDTLSFNTLGISNRIVSNPVTVSVKRGDLLLFKVFE